MGRGRKRIMKIAITGPHGTGKTTACYELAALLKRKTAYTVGIFNEVARDCPFPINEAATIETFQWIFATQMARELEAEDNNDIVVCDRTLLDCVAYANYKFPTEARLYNRFTRKIEWMDSYDIIYYHTPEEFPYLVEDGVREIDKEYQGTIDSLLRALYLKANVRVNARLNKPWEITHVAALLNQSGSELTIDG